MSDNVNNRGSKENGKDRERKGTEGKSKPIKMEDV